MTVNGCWRTGASPVGSAFSPQPASATSNAAMSANRFMTVTSEPN